MGTRLSVLNANKTKVVELLALGLPLATVHDELVDKYKLRVTYSALQSWLSRDRALHEKWVEANQRWKDQTAGIATRGPDDPTLKAFVEKQREIDPFIQDLLNKYHDKKGEGLDYVNAYDVGFTALMLMCRARMVIENRQSGINAIATAQKIYQDAVMFLKQLQMNQSSQFSSIAWVMNDREGAVDPNNFQQLTEIMQAVNEYNNANANKSGQQELFISS